MKKGIKGLGKINGNLLLGLSAMLISLCALYISIQEVRIMRTQQRVSMYPYLALSNTYNSDGFGIYLKNSGTGLANVSVYQVSNDGYYFEDWIDMINTLYPENTTIGYNILRTDDIRRGMISPGEKVRLFFVPWTDETRELVKRMGNVQIRICYSSLLDEHWLLENEMITPQEDGCKDYAGPQFN